MAKAVPIPPEAERKLRLKVEREPANAEAIAALARQLKRRWAPDEALPLFETAAALRPDWSELLDELASVLIGKGELLAADLWLSRIADPARRARREELRAWMRKEAKRLKGVAQACEAEGRMDEAQAAYELMCAYAPDATLWRREAVEFFLSIGRYEAAQAHLEDFADDDELAAGLLDSARQLRRLRPGARAPGSSALLRAKAMEDLKAGRARLAALALRELTLLDPGSSEAWADLRAARLALGRSASAASVASLWAAEANPPESLMTVALARPVSARGLMFDLQERFPLVSKEEALTRVETPEALHRTPDSYLVVDPGGRRTLGHPFFEIRGERPPPAAVRVTTTQSFVLGLDNAMVVGRGAVITQHGQLIAEQFLARRPRKYHATVWDNRAAFDWRLGREPIPTQYFDMPVFLCMGPTDQSFGDWLLQFPPRLLLAEAARLDCRILVSRDAPAKFLEMLVAMGVERGRLLFQKDRRANVYRRVYAPCWPYAPLHRPIANWLSPYKRAVRPVAGGERPLVYLSRRHVDNRPLVNEEQICELFVSRGFREVVPERLSLSETIELFSSAACVAGPWGSAFESVVFSHTPPLAFALMPAYVGSYLHSVGVFMHEAGVKFGYVMGEPVGESGPNTSPWTVSLDRVERGLDQVLERLERDRAAPALS